MFGGRPALKTFKFTVQQKFPHYELALGEYNHLQHCMHDDLALKRSLNHASELIIAIAVATFNNREVMKSITDSMTTDNHKRRYGYQ